MEIFGLYLNICWKGGKGVPYIMYVTYVPVTPQGVFRVGWMTIMQSTCHHRIRRVGPEAVFFWVGLWMVRL